MRIRIFQGRAWWQPLCGCLGLVLMILPHAAMAQQSAVAQRRPPEPQVATARPVQQADDPEPAVDTSADARAASPSRAGVRGATPRSDARPGGGHAGDARAHGKAMDHLQLGTTDITGNRELPKVMYIVPWKHSELGDLTGKPLNSLIDQTLQPVDRDVFQRENAYYRAVTAEHAAAGTVGRGAAAGAAQGAAGAAAHGAAGNAAHDAARSAAGGGQPARDER